MGSQALVEDRRPDASDSDILGYAAANDYVVLTQDLDFGAILAITHGKKPA
jgi:predicted nuclease of predicted toxin-antitoxin system